MFAAWRRAVEHRQGLVLDERRAFQGHPAADHVGRFLDLRLAEAQRVAQDRVVPIGELSIGHPELLAAKLFAQYVLIEDEADLERAEQLRLDLRDRLLVEALRLKRRLV